MAVMLGKATQECGFKHCQTADYRCTNLWQTTLWEVQKARVFRSPLMVIMNFVFHVRLFSPFQQSLSIASLMLAHSRKTLLASSKIFVEGALNADWKRFEPRPNRFELGTAGSCMTIGLSKKPENKIDLC